MNNEKSRKNTYLLKYNWQRIDNKGVVRNNHIMVSENDIIFVLWRKK